MSTRSLQQIKELLQQEFGSTVPGSRDEGIDTMAGALEARGYDRKEAEAALAQMAEDGSIRYIAEPVGGVGAGITGLLEQPTSAEFGITDGRPRRGAVPASQQHGSGYWDLMSE
jgi:hypothetical protein